MSKHVDRSGIVTGRRSPQKQQLARQMREETTPAESALWRRLRANRLDGLHFRRQQVIDGFIVDFYCHAAGLVVEVDGSVHDYTVGRDAERGRILSARGLTILRFTNDRVLDEPESVLQEIAQTAAQILEQAPPPFREGARGVGNATPQRLGARPEEPLPGGPG